MLRIPAAVSGPPAAGPGSTTKHSGVQSSSERSRARWRKLGEEHLIDRDDPFPGTLAHYPQLPASLIDIREQQTGGPPRPAGCGLRGGIFTAWIPALAGTAPDEAVNGPALSRSRNRKSAAPSPRSIAVQVEEAERADPPAYVIRHMADVESSHAVEGIETIQTLIIGRGIMGVGAFG